LGPRNFVTEHNIKYTLGR